MSLRAFLIASTILYRDRIQSVSPYRPHDFPSAEETVMGADELVEFAARSVHGSWDRDNPNTARNDDYLDWLRVLGEFDFFRHASATFWVYGGSLAFARDLRNAAPGFVVTEASLKYRPLSDARVTIPPPVVHSEAIATDLDEWYEEARENAADTEFVLRRRGFPETQAKDGAIAFLPLATETTMVVTGNMMQWADFFDKVFAHDTSAELFEFGAQALFALRQMAPNSVRGYAAVRKSRPEHFGAAPLEEYSECG